MAVAHNFPDQIARMTPVRCAPADRPNAGKASIALRHAAQHSHAIVVDGQKLELSSSLLEVLARAAEVLAAGDAVTIVPVGQELTTQQAADLLNISRQYLVRLLDNGELPHTKTGRHRRMRIEDVLSYKAKRDEERLAALQELTELTEELGGYDAEFSNDPSR